MRRGEARVTSDVRPVVLGLALASAVLGPEFHPPGHYDGDEGSVGLIWLSRGTDVPTIGSGLRLMAAGPEERPAPDGAAGPRNVARDPLGFGAPPA